ncbi:transposase [Lactobacillus helveticus]|nr:transposase [Lactobacillus helveticus]
MREILMTRAETKDEIIKGLMTTINNLNEEISLLREQVAYLTQKRYGKSSEQTPLSGQTSLFDEENFACDEDEDLPC